MTTVLGNLDLNNQIFRSYIFWSSILLLKVLAMALLTGLHRFKNMTFANPEDSAPYKDLQPKFGDQDVERVRRAHRNDLENIFSFVIVAFFYVLTSPTAFIAVNLFRASAISRIVHSIVYAVIPMQPARALSFMVCCVSTVYMALQSIFYFM